MNARRYEEIIAGITPQRIEALIRDLAAAQAPGNREGVGLTPIVNAVTGGEDLGAGAEGWERYVGVRQAIKATVAQIAGMSYVEADD